MNKTIPIICIALFFSIIFLLLTYPQFEANQKNNLKWVVGEYDGTLPEQVMRMINQCKDQDKNPFADYGFDSYSNGHYYFDNVICELINVEKGGCIEPIYNDKAEVIGCGNFASYDYPYGETKPEFNQEFCNTIFNEPLTATDTVETKLMVEEYLNICIERGLIDNELVIFPEEGNLDLVLESCACQNDHEIACFSFGAEWRNATHYIDNNQCAYISESNGCKETRYLSGSYTLECDGFIEEGSAIKP